MNSDISQRCHVTLVVFGLGSARAALEARHVLNMSSTPTETRLKKAEELLVDATPFMDATSAASPTCWLTLKDSHGLWQLGITGDAALLNIASRQLHPLPPLISARFPHPALRGLAFQNDGCLLLFEGSALSPEP